MIFSKRKESLPNRNIEKILYILYIIQLKYQNKSREIGDES